MTDKKVVKDVPADKVEQLKSIALSEGATKVELRLQPDGKYEVIATYSALPGEPKVPTE
jgi:hypothetical protein